LAMIAAPTANASTLTRHLRDGLQETERRGDSYPHARRNHGDRAIRRIELTISCQYTFLLHSCHISCF
jgi:hypothetical protein